jgi:N-acetylmuramoyl-L-alanine amidase
MFGSEILDVAIGLVFIYLLLSLICSVVNEWIAALFSMRAKNLEEGIRNLLHDSSEETKWLANGIYNHSMIAGLFKQDWLNKLSKPSYIPSRTFALALLDTIAPADVNSAQTIDDVRQAIENLPQSRAKAALLTLVNQSQNDLQRFRLNVETWYDNSMDRVSGWYKRKTQVIILVLALLVAVISNADSVAIVTSLKRDPALRASAVTAAQEYMKTNPTNSLNNLSDIESKLEPLHVPIGWEFNPKYPGDPRAFPNSIWLWLVKIFGLLLTAVALSLGAPFWFDILNKFIVIRSTVKPHEKSPDEASKDNTEDVQSAQALNAGIENALISTATVPALMTSLGAESAAPVAPQLPPAATTPTTSAIVKTGADLIEKAKTRLGEEYILGALVPMNNALWHGPWDCAEFVSWCVYQLTGKLYGCRNNNDAPSNTDAYTGWWGRDAGTVVQRITIKQAINTPGAILLRLPHPNMNGHIVISDGQGGTIEAHSRARGVVTDKVAGRRWDMGILVPEISYGLGSANITVLPPDGIYRLTEPPYMRDAVVLQIQKALKDNGINPGTLDGEYGPQTTAAVYSFQIMKGLLADGETGPETLKALGINLTNPPTTPPTDGDGAGSATSGSGPVSPPATGATQFAGLDMGDYPGDKMMREIFGDPYVFTGYSLNSPCHRDEPAGHWRPWMGHWKTLKAIGWGFVVVYVGQQMVGASKCGQNNLTRSQGAIDADDAILKASSDDLTENSIIFLDIEAVDVVTKALADYVRGWVGGLLDAGSYKPGIYCHHKNADALLDAAQIEYEARGLHNEAPAFWVVKIKSNFDVRKDSPADSGIPYASVWQGRLDIKSEVHGQITIKSLDHNVADSNNPSNV